MTFEQMEWITEQTETAVRKALRTYSRRATIGFCLLFAAFMGNLLWSNKLSSDARRAVVRSGDLIAVDGCNRDFQDRVAVRGVLIASRDFTKNAYKRLNLTPEELQLRLDFYNARLKELPLPDCRKSDDILTDDPGDAVTVPTPLYPQSTKAIVPPVSSEGAGQEAAKP